MHIIIYLFILKENHCPANRCSAAHRVERIAEHPTAQGVVELLGLCILLISLIFSVLFNYV